MLAIVMIVKIPNQVNFLGCILSLAMFLSYCINERTQNNMVITAIYNDMYYMNFSQL